MKSTAGGSSGLKASGSPPPGPAAPVPKHDIKPEPDYIVTANVRQVMDAKTGLFIPLTGASYVVTKGGAKVLEGKSGAFGLIFHDKQKPGSYKIKLTSAPGIPKSRLPHAKKVQAVTHVGPGEVPIIEVGAPPCAAYGTHAKCEHAGRAAAFNGKLQVCGTRWLSVASSASFKVKDVGIKIGQEIGSSDKVEISYGKECGKPPPEEGETCGKKHEIVLARDGVEVAKGTEKITANVPYLSLSGMTGLPITKPTVYVATITGCGETKGTYTIEAYPPSRSYVKIDLGALTKPLEAAQKSIGEVCEFLKESLGVEIEIKLPGGTFDASWGWKEHGDGQCLFAYKIGANLRLIEASLKVEVSVIPRWIPKAIRSHVADIFAYFKIEAAVFVRGEFEHLVPGKTIGRLGPGGALSFEIGLEARAGSKYLLEVSVKGYVRTGVNVGGGFTVDPPDVTLGVSLGWDGIFVGISYRVGNGWFDVADGKAEMQLLGPRSIGPYSADVYRFD